jgi:hypothetical protein
MGKKGSKKTVKKVFKQSTAYLKKGPKKVKVKKNNGNGKKYG